MSVSVGIELFAWTVRVNGVFILDTSDWTFPRGKRAEAFARAVAFNLLKANT